MAKRRMTGEILQAIWYGDSTILIVFQIRQLTNLERNAKHWVSTLTCCVLRKFQ